VEVESAECFIQTFSTRTSSDVVDDLREDPIVYRDVRGFEGDSQGLGDRSKDRPLPHIPKFLLWKRCNLAQNGNRIAE
jgi:hypothetical protein